MHTCHISLHELNISGLSQPEYIKRRRSAYALRRNVDPAHVRIQIIPSGKPTLIWSNPK